MAEQLTKEAVLAALSAVEEPALKKSLVGQMLVRDVEVRKDQVSLTVVLLTPAHPLKPKIEADIREALDKAGARKVKLNFVAEVPSDGRARTAGPNPIRNVIAVASGKGGVGKSTVAVNVAVALAQAGAQVGLMDADVYGPNIPTMMGMERLPKAPSPEGRLTPAVAYGVKLMSLGFMVKREQAIVWRGPMLHTAIRQFVQDVDWGELDYLIVDLPPGTGDAQLSLAQIISVTGGLIVTLPQDVSVEDARRGLEMFNQLQVPILGVVENMSYLELPDGKRLEVFGSGGGERLAKEAGVPFIGSIPLDPAVREGGDRGKPIVVSAPKSAAAQALQSVAADLSLKVAVLALRQQAQAVPIQIIN